MTGGVNMAGTPERWEWLKAAWALFKTMGLASELVGPDEIKKMCPIVDVSGIYGGLWDPNEGHLDPYGTTHAYVRAARKNGAEVILHNRVLELNRRPGGGWDVVTEQSTIAAEHVVNAGGLWAKQVGQMAGIDLPVTPMEHHYLLTEDIPEVKALTTEMPLVVDLEGFTYMRQERNGMLLGVYELTPKHWNVEGAPWDYGMELIPEDIDRIAPELAKGFERFPCLETAGIKRWVNGAFTFTPDGNPLVGPGAGRAGILVRLRRDGRVQPRRRRRPGAGPVDGRGRAGQRHLRHGCRALWRFRREPGVSESQDRRVLFAPLRADLSERTAARRPAVAHRAGA